MFHNKGHYLSFKSSVEGIAVPDGWAAIRTDTLRIKNSPRLFTASLIIPFKYGTEAMLEFECVIKSVANLGSEVEC